jgi:hypothetical protein
MVEEVGLQDHVSVGNVRGLFLYQVKFRWLFPVFYSVTTAGTGALLALQVAKTVGGG